MTNLPDVVILGAGSGGYACAFRAAQLGMSVTLVEKDKVGGTCLHRGCIPTKALLHAAEVADTVRDSESFGVLGAFAGIDVKAMQQYKDGVVAKLHKGLQGLVSHHKINVVTGHGRYVGDRTLDVEGSRISGGSLVLATGSYARSVPGIELGSRIITSDEALTLDTVPSRVAILGGGVIGVEFASIWSSFGAEVTIIEALPRLVANEDEWVSKQLARAFRKRRIAAKTSSKVLTAEQLGEVVSIQLDTGETIEVDLLLVAVGRGPRTADSGFAESGLNLNRGFVTVNERLRTEHDSVYAVGDIVQGLQLAHRGFQQGVFVAEEIAGLNPLPVDESGIPRVTYSNPELASVGLTESQARDRHGEITTAVYDLAGNGKSQILGASGGIKLIKAGNAGADGPVVGIHMAGARVGEMISEAQLIVNWGAHPQEVASLIHAHPTQSEAIGEAHMALAGRPLHAHS